MTPIELARMITTFNNTPLGEVAHCVLIRFAKTALESLSANNNLTVTFDPTKYKLVPLRSNAVWVNNMVADGWDNPSATIHTVINFAPELSKLDVTIHAKDITFNPTKDPVPEPELPKDRRENRGANPLGEQAGAFLKMFNEIYGPVLGKTSPEPLANAEKSAWTKQVAGDHYKKMPLQPMEISMRNGLNPLQHTILKYLLRYPEKNGVEDLKKGRHAMDMLIEWVINPKMFEQIVSDFLKSVEGDE